jgi:hypothetical protein
VGAHDAFRRRRARCVPDDPGRDRPSSSAAVLLSASAMACCRSSLPCKYSMATRVPMVRAAIFRQGSGAVS